MAGNDPTYDKAPWHVRHAFRLIVLAVLGILVVYLASAYEVAPTAWRLVERRHPALDAAGNRAFTSSGIPGDPLNVSFVGSEEQLLTLMRVAQWFPADPVTLRSSMKITVDSVFHKPYDDAPVSDLFVYGHKQDLAFEQAANGDPSKRHHVRFWRSDQLDALDRPLWVGAATYDNRVGFSHTTGQITHHIAAEVDAERDKLLADLQRQDTVLIRWIDGFHQILEGKNGGGDRFVTDGRMAVFQVNPAESDVVAWISKKTSRGLDAVVSH
ncbi:MAG: LssY C-terminal domain-containing protein [Rhodoferax sp.]